MTSVDLHLATVALIQTEATGGAPKRSRLGNATGLFFEHQAQQYLVTNRHVVIDDEKGLYPDRLVFRIHASKDKVQPTRDIELDLYDANKKPKWFEYSEKIDLAVLEVGPLLRETDMVFFWKAEHFLPKSASVNLGTQVFVIGYPMGLFESQLYLPIVKSGALASTYGLPFGEDPVFLIDASLHQGNSGSPVIIPRGNVSADASAENTQRNAEQFPSYFLGIFSAYYSVSGISLNLNAVWYADLILDIISQNRKDVA